MYSRNVLIWEQSIICTVLCDMISWTYKQLLSSRVHLPSKFNKRESNQMIKSSPQSCHGVYTTPIDFYLTKKMFPSSQWNKILWLFIHYISIHTHKTGLDSVVLKVCIKCLHFWSSGSIWPHIEMNGKYEKN